MVLLVRNLGSIYLSCRGLGLRDLTFG